MKRRQRRLRHDATMNLLDEEARLFNCGSIPLSVIPAPAGI